MKFLNPHKSFLGITFTLLAISYFSCRQSASENFNLANQELPKKVDFNFHIRPILADRCYKCHGLDEKTRKANLRLDIKEGAFALLDGIENKYAIVPGSLKNSQLAHRITSTDPDLMMPPPEYNLILSDYEIQLLQKWIKQGAEWKPHWAFINPSQPATPIVSNASWPQNAIDYFIMERLDENGWKPTPSESKEKLFRRLSFDLRGLPPSPDEIDGFLSDDSADAYEKIVDQMLASDSYGEHMAIGWLDLARYGDTQGYHHDLERNMWPWKDWVIKSFNQNMPYDKFVSWQLAGDLMPDPTFEQKLATAFNRNHKTSQECGIIEEEFRVDYVLDRTNTVGTAFLGLTVACAQCHDHKYDPISQEEYYSLFAFFNQVPEKGKWPSFAGTSPPSLEIPTEQQKEIQAFIDQTIETEYSTQSRQDSAEAYRWVWEEELDQLLQPVMVMTDQDTLRPTHVLMRGIYDALGKEVQASTPTAILDFPTHLPRNRLGFTKWLFDKDHPLTARVAVNRYWQMIFGRGLVNTPEDFGSQGTLPSHPKLLDYLALSFRDSGWDLKHLMKEMVMSATYQQSARASQDKWDADPENIFLARGPQVRLTAEMIRDQALAVSGLLVQKIGGPGVKPYQPAALWTEVSSGGRYKRKYMQGHGEDLYRRSLYTFWKRIQPPPSMMIFDATSRNNCIIKRQSTSTPLQSMVLLNDPQFTEASRVFAERIMLEGGQSRRDKIGFGFRCATSRFPDEEELNILEQLYDKEFTEFQAKPQEAKAFLHIGESLPNPKLDAIELAAYSVVASSIINLVESIHKS